MVPLSGKVNPGSPDKRNHADPGPGQSEQSKHPSISTPDREGMARAFEDSGSHTTRLFRTIRGDYRHNDHSAKWVLEEFIS